MLKVIELFAGIGAPRKALTNLGIEHEAVISEIDTHAYRSYCAIHGNTPNLGDITKIEALPYCDLLTYGFPCQDISLAGNCKGFEKGSGTRSGLLWEVERLLKVGPIPKILLMENVMAIINKTNIRNFELWISTLSDLGYSSEYAILNTKDFGLPQNRRRCFMISRLDNIRTGFPFPTPSDQTLKDLLQDDVGEEYFLRPDQVEKYEAHKKRHDAAGHGFGWKPQCGERIAVALTGNPTRHTGNFIKCMEEGRLNISKMDQTNRVYNSNGLAPTIMTCQGGNQQIKILEHQNGLIPEEIRIRKMTERELEASGLH